MTIKSIKEELIKKARDKYKKIYPCTRQKLLSDCFTLIDNSLILWFNTKDHSTHIVQMKIKDNND